MTKPGAWIFRPPGLRAVEMILTRTCWEPEVRSVSSPTPTFPCSKRSTGAFCLRADGRSRLERGMMSWLLLGWVYAYHSNQMPSPGSFQQ